MDKIDELLKQLTELLLNEKLSGCKVHFDDVDISVQLYEPGTTTPKYNRSQS